MCIAPQSVGCCTGWDCRTKKDLQALEQKRKDVAGLRNIWITKRQPFMANHLERLAFIDETSVKTNMAKTTGWAPRGQRLTPVSGIRDLNCEGLLPPTACGKVRHQPFQPRQPQQAGHHPGGLRGRQPPMGRYLR